MTAQSREVLILDERITEMATLPLETYLERHAIDLRAMSSGYSTGLYRGYMGLWEVYDGSLYLIGLVDYETKPFDPALVFANQRFPIKAEWFSGCLEVSEGDDLAYSHFGWGPLTAQCLRLYVQRGRLVRRRCYDQTKLLRRRHAALYASDENFREALLTQQTDPLGPLGGLTSAGLRALGMPPFEGEAELAWPGHSGDEPTPQWLQTLVDSCTRPSKAVSGPP